MSLSLELPVLIDASTRAKFVQASSEAMTAAVYAKLDGTDYYSIKGSAGSATVKALWDKAVAANLIASQIVLSADQLNIAGKTVFTSTKTASAISTAQTNAEKTAASQRNEMAQKMGYSSYDDMVNKAAKGQTIIDGGYLRTSLIEVEKLSAEMAKINQVISKKIQSDNYKHNSSGFMLDGSTGEAHFEGDTHIGGNTSISGILQSSDYVKNKQGYKFYPNQETMLSDKETANFIAYLRVKTLSAEEFRGNSLNTVAHNIYEFHLTTAQKILNFLTSIANGDYEYIKIGLWYQCLGSIKTTSNEIQISLIKFICSISENIYQIETRRPQGQVYNYNVGTSSDAQLQIPNLIIF